LIVWVLIGSYLLLVFVLPLGLSALVGYRSLPAGRACPQCRDEETLRLCAPLLDRAARLAPIEVQRRWCLGCGWEGLVRHSHAATGSNLVGTGGTGGTAGTGGTPAGPARPRTMDVDEGDDSDAGQGAERSPHDTTTQTLDVRPLYLDGTPWRVMLQCWRTTGACYGRLVFVAPTGRLWLDAVDAFSGRTEDELLGQAQSLSDRLLATRLRRLVSDH
jgi:hypothetical protein